MIDNRPVVAVLIACSFGLSFSDAYRGCGLVQEARTQQDAVEAELARANATHAQDLAHLRSVIAALERQAERPPSVPAEAQTEPAESVPVAAQTEAVVREPNAAIVSFCYSNSVSYASENDGVLHYFCHSSVVACTR